MRELGRDMTDGFQVRVARIGSRRPAIRFEPTPHRIVTAMLELAQVGAEDRVYDLGSGDGRIPIAAARDFGARAVGIENHPDRVARANLNARAAGIDGRVRFIQQDLFVANVRPATVVTLFLLPEANVMLRPRLLRQLAPGARIVSFMHDMGSWRPRDVHITTDRLGWYHRMYLWTVPATRATSPAARDTPGM